MGENDEVPDAGKHDPGDDEGGGKAEQGPGPGQVDHGGEEVLEEPVRLLVLLRSPVRVQPAVFRNHPVPLRVSVDHSKDPKLSSKRIPPESNYSLLLSNESLDVFSSSFTNIATHLAP